MRVSSDFVTGSGTLAGEGARALGLPLGQFRQPQPDRQLQGAGHPPGRAHGAHDLTGFEGIAHNVHLDSAGR